MRPPMFTRVSLVLMVSFPGLLDERILFVRFELMFKSMQFLLNLCKPLGVFIPVNPKTLAHPLRQSVCFLLQ